MKAIHLAQFRLCASSDLLCSQLHQLLLQLIELLLQFLLVLAPELGGLHFAGRLQYVSALSRLYIPLSVGLHTISSDRAAGICEVLLSGSRGCDAFNF